MRRVVIVVVVLMSISTSLQAATRTSVADGNYTSSSTWDCSCIPANTDDIIVGHTVTSTGNRTVSNVQVLTGAKLDVASGTFTVAQDISIDGGAIFKNNGTAVLKGNYNLLGFHRGTGLVRFDTGGELSGNGRYLNTKGIEFRNGTYHFLAGSDLDLTSSTITLKSNVKLLNFGKLTIYRILGNGTNQIHNRTGSEFVNEWYISLGVHIVADYPNNIFTYSMQGVSNQNVLPADDGYDILNLNGNTLNSKKRPTDDIYVINELNINNATFDVKRSAVISDVQIGGDWNNNSGRFTPRTGTVTFSGSGSVNCHTGLEGFYEVICSGAPRLDVDISVSSEIFISNQLYAQGNDIYLDGDWTCTGTYGGGEGSVVFQGTSGAYISGTTDFDNLIINKTLPGDVTISGQTRIFETLSMDNGVVNTSDNLIIASNSTRTGRLGVMGSGTFNGDLIVERYMNFPENGWHLIGSSVTGMSIAEWNNDFITTGFTGSDWPAYAFCSITRYDETVPGDKDLGDTNIASTAEAVAVGEGRRAYIAAGYNKLSVKGPAVTGPVSWGLSYTDTGNPLDDGWNLVSNPYASTIDWDDTGNWTRVGVKDAVYSWVSEDEQFSSYIAGVGTNGGSRYIPSSQAFWVQTEALVHSMSIVEDAKVDQEQAFRTQEDIKHFKITMTTSNGRTDEVAIRMDDEASREFDSNLDAYKLYSTNNNLPAIGLKSADGVVSSVYSIAEIDEQYMIPMNLHVGVAGAVDFAMTGFENFPAAIRCLIYDAETDEYHQVRETSSLSMDLAEGDYENRFFIVLVPRVVNNPDRNMLGASDLQVWSNENQLFIKNTESANSQVELTIYNGLGQSIFSETNLQIQDVHRMTLPQGTKGLMIIEIRDLETGVKTVERIVR